MINSQLIYLALLLIIICIILYKKYKKDNYFENFESSLINNEDNEDNKYEDSSIEPIISKGKIIGITINYSADYDINDPPDIIVNRNNEGDDKEKNSKYGKKDDAKLYPIIKDKKIIGVVIDSEGSGYTNSTTLEVKRTSSQSSTMDNILQSLKSIKDILYKEYEKKVVPYIDNKPKPKPVYITPKTGSSEMDEAIAKLGSAPKSSYKSFSDITPDKNTGTSTQPVNTKYPAMSDGSSSANNPNNNPPSTIPSTPTSTSLGTNSTLPTTIVDLSDSQILQYAKDYDTAMQPILATQKKAQATAEAQMTKINDHLKKEQDATTYASQNGLPPPPKKYSQTEIDTLNNTINKSKNNKYYSMSNDQKAQCYLLLQDTNNKQAEATSVGKESESNPTLQYSAKQYADQYNIALNKYNSTCT